MAVQKEVDQATESILARVGRELSQLEKRDWELWVAITLTGVVVSIGLLAILFLAAFLKQDSIHFEITVSKQLVLGLTVATFGAAESTRETHLRNNAK